MAEKKKKRREGLPRKPISKAEVKKAGSLRGVYEKRAKEGAEIGMTRGENYPRRVVEQIKKTERPAYVPGQAPPAKPPAPVKKEPSKWSKPGKKLEDIFGERTKVIKDITY